MDAAIPNRPGLRGRLGHLALYRWWRRTIVGPIDHAAVLERIIDESGWSARYAFMAMMSAGIAVLGLLLSSPAVVIGAMLISPLMGPILGFGFSLALFDFRELRRSLKALAIGSLAAVAFTAAIVAFSPLQAPTAEIVARTRPNLFDLGVALFAALAGSFALIQGRGETIVGVAIATALMPPLAVVGFGLATRNAPVAAGAFALFATNFITIALSATAMARFYGFGHHLSRRQTWMQTGVLILVFVAMAIPLGISLNQIGREALAVSQARTLLSERYGAASRVTQLDIDFTADPVIVRAVVIAPRGATRRPGAIRQALQQRLGRAVRLDLDQVLLEQGAGALDAQREELRQAGQASEVESRQIGELSRATALAAGIAPDAVTIDRDHHRVVAAAASLPGASLATYRALEARVAADAEDWDVTIIPPQGPFPEITFVAGQDRLDAAGEEALALGIWAARRWNVAALNVPGLTDGAARTLAQRRAENVATRLRSAAITPVPAEAGTSRLSVANTP